MIIMTPPPEFRKLSSIAADADIVRRICFTSRVAADRRCVRSAIGRRRVTTADEAPRCRLVFLQPRGQTGWPILIAREAAARRRRRGTAADEFDVGDLQCGGFPAAKAGERANGDKRRVPRLDVVRCPDSRADLLTGRNGHVFGEVIAGLQPVKAMSWLGVVALSGTGTG